MKNEETFKENFQDICFIQKKYIPLQRVYAGHELGNALSACTL